MRSSARSRFTMNKSGSLIVWRKQARLIMTPPTLLDCWSCISQSFSATETIYSLPLPASVIRIDQRIGAMPHPPQDGRTETLHGGVVQLGFDLIGPTRAAPIPHPATRIIRAYKLRQQPVEARGDLTAPGSFLWRLFVKDFSRGHKPAQVGGLTSESARF
jgi:hypothetical protein